MRCWSVQLGPHQVSELVNRKGLKQVCSVRPELQEGGVVAK